MSNAKKNADLIDVIAQVRNVNHPGGGMNRAGLRVPTSPALFHVTEEQLEALQNDPNIKVETDAKKIARLVDEEGIEEGQPSNPVIPAGAPLSSDQAGKPREGDGSAEDKAAKKGEEEEDVSKLTKKEIIAKLEDKGLKEGIDFDESSNKDTLLELLSVA